MPKFCQSCAMPIDDETFRGTEADGTKSEDYCSYCYRDGDFTGEMTMEEMIDFCVPITAELMPEKTKDQVRNEMLAFFPTLKRWSKANPPS